jgi:hypothetical protein
MKKTIEWEKELGQAWTEGLWYKVIGIVRKAIHSEREKTIEEIKEKVELIDNFYEYSPKEDMFGVGWERAIDEVLKKLNTLKGKI